MLTRQGLRSVLTRGIRPREDWALGLEFEQFVTYLDGTPLEYLGEVGVERILVALSEITNWSIVREAKHAVGLKADSGQQVTLEPGAQIEFGSSPCKTLKELEQEVLYYCQCLRELTQTFDVRFLALGSQPATHPDLIQRIPKERYNILEPWLAQAGDLGLWMMKTTCGVQLNIDHESESDAMRKLRLGYWLAPVLNAMFANSAVANRTLTGFASWRGHVWRNTDPSRCGLVRVFCEKGATFDDYVDWALDVPMLFVLRDGRYVDCRGRSFRDFMANGGWDDTGPPTLSDWELHLSTPFPEVRLRPQVELRSMDAVGPYLSMALSAFIKGLFYDEDAFSNAEALFDSWSFKDLKSTWHRAHREGLAAALPSSHAGRGGRLLDLARELLSIVSLSTEDAYYLEALHSLLRNGHSLGESTTQNYLPGGVWNRALDSSDELDLAPLVRLTGCPFSGE